MKKKSISLSRALAVLGLRRDASLEDVKHRFRKMALRVHPDQNAGDPAKTAQFIRIRRAYEVIVEHRAKWKRGSAIIIGHVVESSDSEGTPYVLHGPRGRVVILVRQQRMPAVLYAVDKKGHRTAIHWNGQHVSYFTDRDGKLRIWDFT